MGGDDPVADVFVGPPNRRPLVFDADDTLWENNVLFERVVEDYLEWLAHPTLERCAMTSS